jgi:hypothetical protein
MKQGIWFLICSFCSMFLSFSASGLLLLGFVRRLLIFFKFSNHGFLGFMGLFLMAFI